ncbi:MAG: phenyltransferase domain-containing protein [Deltaproteobacteria bacterium]|nr:phenyltransferase domain-containing protein [Deltaproteobacteria bacterium]
MELKISRNIISPHVDMSEIALFIAGIQKENGEIPWSKGGKTDPWDHVESAMGLSVAGYLKEAEHAYEWMIKSQLKDGSWWSATREGIVEDSTRESNMSSYIAVGVFHHYLISKDTAFLHRMWPTLRAGVDYAVSLQAPEGEIYWAKNGEGVIDPMALLTGSSSVYMSIKCALVIASLLGKSCPAWVWSLKKLGNAIRNKPDHFNMIKSRYSMDWYYPVLGGAVTGNDAKRRIDKFWDKFVVPDWGVRCVSDHPWVTMAETSELVLALTAIGEYERAEMVFNWLGNKKYSDGSYWMGVTFPDCVIWPEEKTAWTSAAALLAYDALNDLTPASRLFSHSFWSGINTRMTPHARDAYRRSSADKDWIAPPQTSMTSFDKQG